MQDICMQPCAGYDPQVENHYYRGYSACCRLASSSGLGILANAVQSIPLRSLESRISDSNTAQIQGFQSPTNYLPRHPE